MLGGGLYLPLAQSRRAAATDRRLIGGCYSSRRSLAKMAASRQRGSLDSGSFPASEAVADLSHWPREAPGMGLPPPAPLLLGVLLLQGVLRPLWGDPGV